MVRPEDYLLLMFSMKGEGKRVDFKHVKEKMKRDLGISDEIQIKKILESLIKDGFLEEVEGLYGVTKKGREFFARRIKAIEAELRKVNEPWVIVYKAKQYYPVVANTILEFCRERYVGFYCLFTEKRFFRRDFRGRKITVNSLKDLMFYVNMHYIDIIPCVHRIGSNRPDWLVVDIDAGPKVSWEQTKEVTEIVFKIFKKFGLNPALKFSGSRGFQVWSLIEEFPLPENYKPLELRGKTIREKNYFSLFSDFIRIIQREVDKEIPGLTTCEVAAKEKRLDKVLLDPSSMKPLGLVRAPYGLHSKTGLISMPLSLKELKEFEPEQARVELVVERYKRRGNEFILKPSNPSKLIQTLI
ncbi:MAG: hypothetical protein DRP00_01265 [Candidatus Aenigmatarchaeota archaeon]|nr:MAG: hypothetical protein DRP00_01265 [Candidatus Aenigmarchaeota archaeon]